MMTLQRINVIGTTGSGKTTIATQLSQRLGLPHIELDALFWGPNWTESPAEVFRERVARALESDTWVIDGNYSRVRDLIWEQAQALVWLDLPLPLILWQLFKRTTRRSLSQELLWNSNRERLRDHFLSRQSLFLWALQSNKRQRKNYPLLFVKPEYTHLRVYHLHTPVEIARWLAGLPSTLD
jgi:adenylate kinase family enzyme